MAATAAAGGVRQVGDVIMVVRSGCDTEVRATPYIRAEANGWPLSKWSAVQICCPYLGEMKPGKIQP